MFQTIAGQSSSSLSDVSDAKLFELQVLRTRKSRECIDSLSGGEVTGLLIPAHHQ
jgi:hypothetical protein